MQQRRLRLGDILDDYCPRERRVTNHAVVAMIEDDVKQTRCTTCDAEHEYKHAKVPAPRRKKPASAPAGALVDPRVAEPQPVVDEVVPEFEETTVVSEVVEVAAEPESDPDPDRTADTPSDDSSGQEDEWPVHRPLIRATLPRPEGQVPERRPPDFTIRQNNGRFDGQRNGNRARNKQARRGQHAHGAGQSRFGNSHSGHQSRPPSGHPQRHGNRQGPSTGQRGHGHGGGHKPGHGRGPKRGR